MTCPAVIHFEIAFMKPVNPSVQCLLPGHIRWCELKGKCSIMFVHIITIAYIFQYPQA